MNNEVDIIGFLIFGIICIGGAILYTFQVLEEVKNNRMKTKKEIELLDIKILEVGSRIK